MKSTAERLSEVYCKTTTYKKMREVIGSCDESVGFGSYCGLPNSDSEMFFYYSESDGYVRVENNKPDCTKIPVQHFIDLLKDNIAAWRLEEDGFNFFMGKFPYYEFHPRKRIKLSWSETTKDSGVALELPDDAEWLNIKTYTQLLTLIELIG
jgi:hypothetical protein